MQTSTKPLALILEDEVALANIFETCLKKAGFETRQADDGGIAAKLLDEIDPHLFILDLHVPIFSGEEILERIKANPKFNNARIILATADARLAEQLRSKVDFVLDKPVSSRQLILLATRLREQISIDPI